MKKTILYTPKRINKFVGTYSATILRCTSPLRWSAFFNGTCAGSFRTQRDAIKEVQRVADNRETLITIR